MKNEVVEVYTVVVRDLTLYTEDTVYTTQTIEKAKELLNATISDFHLSDNNSLIVSDDGMSVYDEYEDVVDGYIVKNYIR